MTAAEYRDIRLQDIALFLHRDSEIKLNITRNAAMRGGKMKAAGWRTGMESDAVFGTYAFKERRRQTHTMYRHDDPAFEPNCGVDALNVHQIMAKQFHLMAPDWHKFQVEMARKRKVPLAGQSADAWRAAVNVDSDDELEPSEITPESLYCSNITYTYGLDAAVQRALSTAVYSIKDDKRRREIKEEIAPKKLPKVKGKRRRESTIVDDTSGGDRNTSGTHHTYHSLQHTIFYCSASQAESVPFDDGDGGLTVVARAAGRNDDVYEELYYTAAATLTPSTLKCASPSHLKPSVVGVIGQARPVPSYHPKVKVYYS
ncbi:MAG: hypothetical protein M1816_004595 [Peltula sp. TS41687]|nr:MAG: hypothetical protein M1816_004595 [Peltula sp. TS41687]